MLTHRGASARPLVVMVGLSGFIYLFWLASSMQLTQAGSHPLDSQTLDSTTRSPVEMSPKGGEGAKEEQQHVPVIGVLTQVLRDYKRFSDKRHLHLAASYVKWIESSGAQVVPILLNQDEAYYERLFNQTNGLLFPGGDNLLDPSRATPMMLAAKKLYKLAVEANNRGDYYPIWGTCLGLELLSVLSSGKNELDSCDSIDTVLNVNFVERGKLFEANKNSNLEILIKLDYAKFIMETLQKKPASYNYHRKCLTDAGMKRANLQHFYRPLGYSYDKNGIKFVAIFEAINYPFFGVQFHPEKPAFEFTRGHGHFNVPHTRESIEVSRYFADFFFRQAQRNGHRVANWRDIQMELIYADEPVYTAPLNDLYEQRYLFPFSDASNWKSELDILKETPQGSRLQSKGTGSRLPIGVSPVKNADLLIEFIDYVPRHDEVIPEDADELERQQRSQQRERLLAPNKGQLDIQLAVYSAELDQLPLDDEPDRTVLPRESARG